MKRVTRAFFAFVAAFLIVFSTLGNAFFVASAMEPTTVVTAEDATTGGETSADNKVLQTDDSKSGDEKVEDQVITSENGETKEESEEAEDSDKAKADDSKASNDTKTAEENTESTSPSATETVDTADEKIIVTATPAAGEVEKGTKVVLSSSVEGAVIKYNVGGSAFRQYDPEKGIVVDEDVTIKAYATLDENSSDGADPVEFKYTVKKSQETNTDALKTDAASDATYSDEATELKDGDKVILVAQSYALTAVPSDSKAKLSTTALSKDDNGSFIVNEAAEVLTVETKDGLVAFKNAEGKYLSTPSQFKQGLGFSETCTNESWWVLEGLNSGFNVKSNYTKLNNADGKFQYIGIGSDNKKDVFSVLTLKNNDKFVIHFYYADGESSEAVTVDAPKASIVSGSKVEFGEEVELTCATEGAKIYYSTTGKDGEFKQYSEKIAVTGDMTISAYAEVEGDETVKSEVADFTYELFEGTKITDITKLSEGKEFVLVFDGEKAMTTTANGKKLEGYDVKVNDDSHLTCKVLGTSEDGEAIEPAIAKLKLVAAETEGEYYITTDISENDTVVTKYLTSGVTGNSLSFEADKKVVEDKDYSLWAIEAEDNGAFLIKSVNAEYKSKAQYMEFYNALFTVYGYTAGSDKTAYTFNAFTFPELEEEEVQEPENTVAKLLTRELYDGDEVVIYYPTDGKAMTAEAASGKLKDVAVTVAEDKTIETKDTNAAVFTVSADGKGNYSFQTAEGKFLAGEVLEKEQSDGKKKTYTNLILTDEKTDACLWSQEKASEDGKYYLKSVNVKYNDNVQALEYYKGFSLFGFKESNIYAFSFYALKEGEKPAEQEEPLGTEGKLLTRQFYNGDKVVVYYPASKTLMTSELSNGKFKAASAEPLEGKLETKDLNALVLTVSVDDKGQYTLKSEDGKYLTATVEKNETSGKTYCGLALDEAASDNSVWYLKDADDKKEGNFYLMSAHGKNGSYDLALEYYSGFTSYGFKEDKAYVFNFYALKEGEKVVRLEYDKDVNLAVAQWAGNAHYDEAENSAEYINGDLFETNDMLDKNAKYTAVVNGKTSQPWTSAKSSTTGSTNYYMGSIGVVSSETDYMQFELSTLGYANLGMEFRMRASNTAAGSFQLQYSTDGENFKNFTTGKYSYKYTAYKAGDKVDENGKAIQEPFEVNGSGDITDGIAKTSLAPTYYVTFNFDIPSGAANSEKVYIRLTPVAGTMSAKGDKAPANGGVIRLDGVKIQANPVVDDSVTGFVTASPASGAVALGEEIALSSATEDAEIFYSVNGGEFVKYDDAVKVSFSELPATLSAYAKKAGLADSIVVNYQYTQAQVAAVKANPNGGAVFQDQYVSLKTATKGATILYRFRTAEEIAKDNASEEEKAKETSEDTAVTEETMPEEEAASEEETHDDWKVASSSIQLTELPCQIQVKAVKTGYKDSAVSTLKYTKKLNDKYNVYFGQVHAHTNISDGAGTLDEALAHASKVDNLDFIVITDHSNSIDNEKESIISQNVDKNATDEWTYAHNLAKQYTTEDFTCAYGYEMTWSNGLGHMNTFNTPGFQSRTQTQFSTYSTALQNYYEALRTVPDSISQFNHPGTTFGDFQDFAYYSEENDALITMIEVGNGEGTIGSSGYFPSYEYYTRALDKGWHVAPTNNQDNHKGKWGDANTARTVMLADTNDEEAIYDAMRNYRIYATEDNDLSIYYTLEGNIMGTILEKDAVGDHLSIKADITDPTDAKIGKVEVIVNGGQSIASKEVNGNSETVDFIVPSHYSYYYLKITEPDGNIAVTAPVWVGEVEACGINKTYTNTVLPVKGESLDVNVDFYNNEESELKIDNINIVVKDVDNKVTEVVNVTGEEAGLASVAPQGTATYKTDYVYSEAGQVTYEVTVNATLNGVSKVYSDKLQLSYTVPDMVTDVIIDGTHYNDYVTGYYGGNMSAFISICAKKNIRAEIVTDSKELTADRLAKASLFVVSAPAKKNGTANAGDYTVSHFSDDFIAMVKDYVANGGSVIVCGLADYSDSTDCQTVTEQNKLLEAIGSTIRMGSDEVCDDTNNGGQVYRMYPATYNLESELFNGVFLPQTDENGNVTKEGQKYSQYSGCSVDISNATATDFVEEAQWLVKGFDTTYSVDCKDAAGNAQPGVLDNGVKGIKNDNQGNVTFLATQKTKAGGRITVAGGVFVSDFEVKAEMDNNDSLPFTNYTIVNNILDGVTVELPTSTIAQARAGAMNEVFAVEGYVTSGTDNENTTFFDTIYLQDETAGIDIFPYATPGLAIGTKMRIVGYVSQYQGDKELKVISSKILDAEPKIWEPKEVTTKDAMDYDALGGSLLKTTGKVTRVAYASDEKTIEEFWLKDDTGVEAAIFIDGYIYSATTGKNELADFVKVGAEVSAVGVLYMHPEGDSEVSVPVFRVRNCDDIQLVKEALPESGHSGSGSHSGNSGSGSSGSSSGGSSDSSDNGGNDSGSSNNGSTSGSSSSSNSQTTAPTVLGAVKNAVEAGVDTAKEVYKSVFNALTGKNKQNASTEDNADNDENGETVGTVTGIEDGETPLADTPAEQIEQPSENTGDDAQTPDQEQTTIEEEQTPKADSVVPKGVKVAAAVAGIAAVAAGIGVAIKHLIAALIVK